VLKRETRVMRAAIRGLLLVAYVIR
jgi:hypothetical protein